MTLTHINTLITDSQHGTLQSHNAVQVVRGQ